MSVVSSPDLIDSPDAHVGVLPCEVTVRDVISFNGLLQISESWFYVCTGIKSLDLVYQGCWLGFLQARVEFSLSEDVLVETQFVVDVLVFSEQGQKVKVPIRVKVLHRAHLLTHLRNIRFWAFISNCSNKVLLIFHCYRSINFERIVNHSLVDIIKLQWKIIIIKIQWQESFNVSSLSRSTSKIVLWRLLVSLNHDGFRSLRKNLLI